MIIPRTCLNLLNWDIIYYIHITYIAKFYLSVLSIPDNFPFYRSVNFPFYTRLRSFPYQIKVLSIPDYFPFYRSDYSLLYFLFCTRLLFFYTRLLFFLYHIIVLSLSIRLLSFIYQIKVSLLYQITFLSKPDYCPFITRLLSFHINQITVFYIPD